MENDTSLLETRRDDEGSYDSEVKNDLPFSARAAGSAREALKSIFRLAEKSTRESRPL